MDPTPPTGAGMAALIPLWHQGGTYLRHLIAKHRRGRLLDGPP